MSTNEELLERKSCGCDLENQDNGRKGSAALTTRQTFYPKMLTLTSTTSGGLSVGTVRSRTQATEFLHEIETYQEVASIRGTSHLASLYTEYMPKEFRSERGEFCTHILGEIYLI
jgi:hypothetical protein